MAASPPAEGETKVTLNNLVTLATAVAFLGLLAYIAFHILAYVF